MLPNRVEVVELEGAMLVRNRMTQNPATVTPEDMLTTAQEKMTAGRFRHIPVVEDDGLVGMLTTHDMQAYVGMEDRTRVNMAMVALPLTIAPSATVEDAAKRMLEKQIRGLPVVEGKRLVGVITTSDILQDFLDAVGANAAGSFRIDIVDEKSPPLTLAMQLVQNLGGEVLSTGTYDTPGGSQKGCYLRLRGIIPDKASTTLKDAGYTVLNTHV